MSEHYFDDLKKVISWENSSIMLLVTLSIQTKCLYTGNHGRIHYIIHFMSDLIWLLTNHINLKLKVICLTHHN